MAPRPALANGAQRKRLTGSLRAAPAKERSHRDPADNRKVEFRGRRRAGSRVHLASAPGGEFRARVWLAGFALVICGLMIGLFTIDGLHARNGALAVARSGAQNLSESLAQQAGDTFEAIDGVLLAIAGRVESSTMTPLERDRLRAVMTALAGTMPHLHDLLVIDGQGRLVASNTAAAARRGLRLRDQPFFAYHRTHPDLTLHITGPVRSEIEQRWVLDLTRRLNRKDGSFAGVVLAHVALDYFEQRYAAVDVGRFGAVSLLADDGTLIVRRPRVRYVHKLSTAPFTAPFKYRASGWYLQTSPFDGKRKLHAFRRLDRFALLVNVAVAEDEYLAEWRSTAWLNGAALLLVTALIVALAVLLGAQIDRRRLAEQNLALVDALTGLANRRQFDTVLQREWRRAIRERAPLALLMIDVDHFKAFNDRYGHRHGDVVLTVIAQAIDATVVRPGDLVARYGGEEFAVVLPATNTSSALIVAERIRHAIVALDIPHANAAGAIASVSIGAASIAPAQSDEQTALIDAADAALYAAKRSGRNRSAAAPGSAAPSSDPGSQIGRP